MIPVSSGVHFWVGGLLQALAISGALGSGYFWVLAARVKLPESKALIIDATNFDWLTAPLARQAKLNSTAAWYAAGAALTAWLGYLWQNFTASSP